jgi:ribosome-associated toxin RatA of RatAB toxin-antitoxin module
MKRPLVLLLFLLPQALAGEIAIDAARRGPAIVVSAQADLHADVRTAWQVLTDYDRYASFIPDLTVSRVLSRGPGSAVVEQRGEARFLFLSYPLEVRLAVAETPYRSVRSRAIAGNFRELVGRYELEPTRGGLRLVYSGRMVLGEEPPGLVDVFVIRRNVARQFEALVREIDRRAAGGGAEIPKG